MSDQEQQGGAEGADEQGEATFQNGAGETAPISAISEGTVAPIEPAAVEQASLKVESITSTAASEVAQEVKDMVRTPDGGIQVTVGDVQASPVPPAPAPKAAPVVSAPQKTAPVVSLKQPAAAEGFRALIEKMKTDGTKDEKKLIANIEQYMQRMAPGQPMGGDDGARNQHALWKVIQGLVERAPQEEFRKLWNILLGYFEESKDGVFGDRYIFRFAESWHHSEAELTAFQRILNVIKLTSNANERSKGLRQVDLGRSLETGFSEEARQRLLSFYQQ